MVTKSLVNIKEEFLSFTKEDAVDLYGIANFVKSNCNSTIPLIKPRGSTLRICGQDGTLYEGAEEQLEAWKDYYLPERMEMEVIGAIDDFPCEAFGLQLVLLLGQDGSVFAYEDELLHLVARSLRDLFQCEMVFPGLKTFKLGECFEEPTEDEYNEMLESDEVKEMKKLHMDFRESLERELLNTMNEIAQSRNNNQLDDNQGFNNGHSTETALLPVNEALRIANADSKSSALILPDQSTTFDTAGHQNLLSTHRPLGILRFFTHSTFLGHIMQHGFSYHYNAYYTQLSFPVQPEDPTVAAYILKYLKDILARMKFNLVNIEFLSFPATRTVQPNFTIQLGSSTIIPSNLSRNCGVIRLTFKRHRRPTATTAQSSRFSWHNKAIQNILEMN